MSFEDRIVTIKSNAKVCNNEITVLAQHMQRSLIVCICFIYMSNWIQIHLTIFEEKWDNSSINNDRFVGFCGDCCHCICEQSTINTYTKQWKWSTLKLTNRINDLEVFSPGSKEMWESGHLFIWFSCWRSFKFI